MTVAMKAILLPKNALDPQKLLRAVENALTGTAQSIKVDFDTTTRTWQKRPVFTIQVAPFQRIIGTDDDVYRYVSRGTSIRYALMSGDFAPKTRNRYLGSNVGKGGVVSISKKHPRPGIQAREFEQAVQDKYNKEFPVNVQRAIDAALPPT